MCPPRSPFARLADDLLVRICTHLGAPEFIVRLSGLNHQWHRVCSSGSLWRSLYARNFGAPPALLHFSQAYSCAWREEIDPKFWKAVYGACLLPLSGCAF